MDDHVQDQSKKQQKLKPTGKNQIPGADHPLEEDPAVERGERLATGKRIARSGKEQGFVPGATPPKS